MPIRQGPPDMGQPTEGATASPNGYPSAMEAMRMAGKAPGQEKETVASAGNPVVSAFANLKSYAAALQKKNDPRSDAFRKWLLQGVGIMTGRQGATPDQQPEQSEHPRPGQPRPGQPRPGQAPRPMTRPQVKEQMGQTRQQRQPIQTENMRQGSGPSVQMA